MGKLRDITAEVTKDHGNRCTDKHRSTRQHLCLYEQILPPYQYTAKKVAELGVNRGGSIMVWQNYFTNATIYGVDIRHKSLRTIKDLDRVVPVHLDQSDPKDLKRLAAEGPFDVFIDDGSHVWSHQINTFEAIWPSISPGGIYVLEDTCTSYTEWLDTEGQKRTRTKYDDQEMSTMEYFKALTDHINFDGGDYNRREQVYTDLQSTIDVIGFRTNIVYATKRFTKIDPFPDGFRR